MRKGFTLIELLVVVLIIGILSAVALPQYTKAVEKARVAEAMIILRTIADANQRYYLSNGEYTWSLANLDIQIPGEDITRNGMDRKQTKYFQYGAQENTKDDVRGVIAIANRLPAETNYYLTIHSNVSGIYCVGYNTIGEKNCKMLGASTTATPIGGTNYYLLAL